MPIGILEPFDHYASLTNPTTGGFASVWNCAGTGTNASFATGLGGQGKCLVLGSGSNGSALNPNRFFPRTDKVTLAFALRIDAVDENSGASPLLTFRDSFTGSFVNQFQFCIEQTQRLTLRGEGGAIVATADLVPLEGQVYRFNMQIDMVTHDVVTKINGGVDAGMSGNFDIQDGATTFVDNIYMSHYIFFNNTQFTSWVIDDLLIIYDELRDLPPVEMFTMAATADVLAQFTRLSGATNYEMIDDLPFDGDTTYNHSTTPGHKDIFQYGALPKTPESIICVSALNVCKKDESDLRELRNVIRVDGTDYPDTGVVTLPENYYHYFTHWEENPDTAAPWVVGDFPLQLGYELVT